MSETCISMALSDFYTTHNYTTKLVLHTRDSKKDIVGATSAALDLMKNVQVKAIIGPETSAEAKFLIDLGNKVQVPIISFSASSPSLSSIRAPYFIRTTQNDSAQVGAISAIIQAFRWRQIVPVYEDTDYGNGIISYLTDALEEINVIVPYRSVIPPHATDDQIEAELYKLMTMQTRVFVVHMFMALGMRFFTKAKEIGMRNDGYVWIITDGMTNQLDTVNSTVIDSMQGVLGVKPYVPRSRALEIFTVRMERKLVMENTNGTRPKLSVFGLWAYDTVWALAEAVNKIGKTKSGFEKPKGTGDNSTDLASLGVSQIGPKLLEAMMNTRFRGLSGDFQLINWQLQSPAFQIVNIVGKSGRHIGIWRPRYGISRNLSAINMIYSTSKDDLKVVIWPGDTTEVPKGWEIPTNGKKLRIGVPFKDGFSEFVKVDRDSATNATKVTGFTIDVFNAVLAELPYALPYEFVPFEGPVGKSAGTYNDLIYQVYLQNYDAVVGDVTITANRSLYVDFSLPYTDSGVSMVVPIRDDNKKNAWVFLKPLSKNLWLMTGAAFIFTGFVVWLLEHRINPEFRGPPSQQAGMIFWFSFSTLVFAHKERVLSNLARFVVIIWVFVVLILTSSYTAGLTSMLTVQQLMPTVTDVNELIKNGDYVGYQQGSFVLGLLKKLKFDESKLRVYNSPDEYAEALSKGSRNGGVAAIFDEIPYIKVFLAQSCNHYTMVGPTYKTDGFGLAFPKGSPLVSDVSTAVLNVTEEPTMVAIEQAWFGQSTCTDSAAALHSNSLTLESFWGLFLVAGIAAAVALLIFLISFLRKNRHVLLNADSDRSLFQRVFDMVKHFDQRDLSSHTFRRDGETERIAGSEAKQAEVPTPRIHPWQSPSSFSNSPVRDVVTDEDEGFTSIELISSPVMKNPSREITTEKE
ncbi:glutamate receptor 2.8-like [Aristolochia californica]|uniref:glutamate receptor 2.8-like n=1 Tax=Aristolochia californica TaxID=171875 RepID=UPI0035DB28EC